MVIFDFYLTCQDVLDRFKNIYILADPPGVEDIKFDEYVYKDFYMDKCFKKFKVGIKPDQKRLIK